MSTINDGGPAFPHEYNGQFPHTGMSLRAWFAGQALPGLIKLCAHDDRDGMSYPDHIALKACEMADALIAELEGK